MKRMRSIFKDCSAQKEPKYFIEHNAELPPLNRYSVLIEIKSCSLSLLGDELLKLVSRDTNTRNLCVGKDISGIVRGIGNLVTTLKPGDEVAGIIPLDYGLSGCAEYVILHEYDVAKKPQTVSFVEAAAVIGDCVRAYTALHYLGHLNHGDTVLIMDAASAFGSLCAQLANHWGAKVIATASSEEEKESLKQLKDDLSLIVDLDMPGHAKNFNQNDQLILSACMEESGGLGVDIIIDNGVALFTDKEFKAVAKETYSFPVPSKSEIISTLSVGGRWITSKENLQLDPENSRLLFMKCATIGFLFEHAWTLSSTNQGQYQHILMDIMEKAADGIIKPTIHSTVNFENVPEAMMKLQSVRVGKIVMTMD